MKLIKKMLIPSILLLTLIISMVSTASATYDCVYTAPYGTPTIDGNIEELWDGAEWTLVDKPYLGKNHSDSIVKVKLVWDESHVYFLAEITDNSYNENCDCFEVYLDQSCDRTPTYGPDDSQTRFLLKGETVKGTPNVAGKNAQQDAEFKVKSNGNTYIMEGALSYTAGTPQAGSQMGLEFMYGDGKAGDTDIIEAYRWNINQMGGDQPAWASTEHWGTLVFADENGEVPDDFELVTLSPATTTEAPVTTARPTKITGKPVTTTAASTTTAAVDDATAPAGLPTGAIIGISVAAVAVVAAVVIIVVKKKNQ